MAGANAVWGCLHKSSVTLEALSALENYCVQLSGVLSGIWAIAARAEPWPSAGE
jgi:hypothetical protein